MNVVALASSETPQRLGVLAGEIAVPADFNGIGEVEIEALFGSGVHPTGASSTPLSDDLAAAGQREMVS